MTIKVTRGGQEFTFDDGTPQNVIDRRIESWLKQNKPEAVATPATPAPSSGGSNSTLATIAKTALATTPLGLAAAPLMAFPGARKAIDDRLGDVNLYRTIGQGVIPLADEGVASIRSLIPKSWGGTDYDTALAAERQGVKDYAEKHGEAESLGLQLAGGLATIPLTMGAGAALQGTRGALAAGQLASKLPLAGKFAQLAAKYPTIAQGLTNTGLGGAIGAGTGFAAGEGDFETRAANAGWQGLFGAGMGAGATGIGKIAEHTIGKMAGGDNAVANYLRKRLVGERGEQYGNTPGIERLRDVRGDINVNHPEFANLAADDLAKAAAEQRSRAAVSGGMGPNPQKGHDVMLADVLPGTTEAVSLKPGPDTAQLGKDIIRRQYNKELPEQWARAEGQQGLVDNWFKRLYGDANFRGTEEDLLKTMQTNAQTAFRQADPHTIMSLELGDVMDRVNKLSPNIIKRAQTWAEAERGGPRSTGHINPQGEYLNFNTKFLHDIKRSINEEIGLGKQGNIKFHDKPYLDAVTDLNAEMKRLNPDYRHAMEQYGEDAGLLEALRKGRQDVFGKNVNELDQGIGKQDIEAFLNDPNNSQAAKDLFRIGGARSIYQKLMGSDAANFGSNWAGVVNKPNLMEKFEALVPEANKGMWTPMRDEMMQLSERHQNAARALAGSQTAKRTEMTKELQSPSYVADIVATLVNPSAPSASRNWAARFMDPEKHSKETANAVAKLLAMKGEAGNETAVERIRSILQGRQRNQSAWNTGINTTARGAAYSGLPSKRRHAFSMPSDESH